MRGIEHHRIVQHKTPIGLHRAAAKDGLVRQVGAAHGQFDLFQQGLEAQAAGLVDHQPQGAAFVVFAHIHHTAGEKLVFQLRHGNQKVVGKVEHRFRHRRRFYAPQPPCPPILLWLGPGTGMVVGTIMKKIAVTA